MSSTLYIFVGQKEFLLSTIFDEEITTIQHIDRSFVPLRELTKESELFEYQYTRYKIQFCSEQHAIVPALMYKSGQKEKLITLEYGPVINPIVEEMLPSIESYQVFALNPEIQYLNSELPGTPIITDYAGSMAQWFLHHLKEKESPCICAFLMDNRLDILFIHQSVLQFYNRYTVQKQSDILYYILYCIDTFGLNGNDLEIFLTGEFKQDDESCMQLSQYVESVYIFRDEEKLKSAEIFVHQYASASVAPAETTFAQKSNQEYSHLISLLHCE